MQLPVSIPASASAMALASPKVLHFLRLQKPNLLENNLSNTRNDMKSKIKNKKNGSISQWNYEYQY